MTRRYSWTTFKKFQVGGGADSCLNYKPSVTFWLLKNRAPVLILFKVKIYIYGAKRKKVSTGSVTTIRIILECYSRSNVLGKKGWKWNIWILGWNKEIIAFIWIYLAWIFASLFLCNSQSFWYAISGIGKLFLHSDW